MVGAMFMMDSVDDQQYQTIQAARLRTGVDLRFIFDTTILQKDVLIAEIVVNGKVVVDWLSAVAIPVGA